MYVLAQIQLLEGALPDGCKHKSALIKGLVAWALQQFNSTGNFKHDKRMLALWRLLGKYSQELKMNGVMEKIYRLGKKSQK